VVGRLKSYLHVDSVTIETHFDYVLGGKWVELGRESGIGWILKTLICIGARSRWLQGEDSFLITLE
jgi:hypothetical protein